MSIDGVGIVLCLWSLLTCCRNRSQCTIYKKQIIKNDDEGGEQWERNWLCDTVRMFKVSWGRVYGGSVITWPVIILGWPVTHCSILISLFSRLSHFPPYNFHYFIKCVCLSMFSQSVSRTFLPDRRSHLKRARCRDNAEERSRFILAPHFLLCPGTELHGFLFPLHSQVAEGLFLLASVQLECCNRMWTSSLGWTFFFLPV